MKNKKRNTIITIGIIIAIFLIGITVFVLNYSSDESSLTIIEKKWITDYTNKIVDVEVYNDIPVYGYNGNGIIFDFLDYFTEKYAINFNKISYYTEEKSEIEPGNISFLLLDANKEVGNQDILLYEDDYVILGMDTKEHISLNQISKLGVLTKDSKILKDYFQDEVECIEYETIEKLIEAMKNEEIEYIILPSMNYMDDILKNDMDIVYHVTDLKKKYVLRVKDETIYTIMKKSYLEYLKEDYFEDYSKNYLDMYFTSTSTTDLSRKNYNAKAYKYGYVINMPYENYVNEKFVGTISNYLTTFEKQADVELEVVRYNNIDDLKSALVSGEVDFAYGNFDYQNINMKYTTSNTVADLEYLVLSKEHISMNSIKGLADKEVSVVGSSSLDHLCSENGIKTKKFENTDELLRSLEDQSIVLMDKQTYIYYKDNKLKDYKIVYEGILDNGYKFIFNEKNEPFNSLFSYYVSTIDYDTIKYEYHTSVSIDKDYASIKIIGFIVALIFFLVSTVVLINRKNVTNPTISKDEVLKYIDPMTSLKNRNYLNVNIYKWDDNVIFPQSIVVLDLNNLKEINDKLGREAGDEVIKKVASILINNQLENTDIIRSGGDEFLIYMVGYEEKKVTEYTKKLLRIMKDIPNSLGIEVGYSMILDEVKTVDDAINEAIIMMTKNKEKKKLGE